MICNQIKDLILSLPLMSVFPTLLKTKLYIQNPKVSRYLFPAGGTTNQVFIDLLTSLITIIVIILQLDHLKRPIQWKQRDWGLWSCNQAASYGIHPITDGSSLCITGVYAGRAGLEQTLSTCLHWKPTFWCGIWVAHFNLFSLFCIICPMGLFTLRTVPNSVSFRIVNVQRWNYSRVINHNPNLCWSFIILGGWGGVGVRALVNKYPWS